MSAFFGNFFKNSCNVYTLGWLIYYSQKFISVPPVFFQILAGLLLGVSLINVFRAQPYINQSHFLKFLNYFLLFLLIYWVVYLCAPVIYRNGLPFSKTQSFKQILLSLLPIYSYYYYSVLGLCNEKWIENWLIPLFLAAFLGYLSYASYGHYLNPDAEEITNNAGYGFLALLPALVFVREKPAKMFVFLIIITVFVLIGMKRGAILIALIAIPYFFISIKNSISPKVRKSIIFVFVLFVCFSIFFVRYQINTSDYFVSRIDQTKNMNASNRENMYPFLFNHFLNADIFEQVFGGGLDNTLTVIGDGAHNDWLEILIDHGIIGVIMFFLFWVNMYKDCKLSKNDRAIYAAMLIFILMNFLKTLFSFSFNNFPVWGMPVFGYCLYRINYSNLNYDRL